MTTYPIPHQSDATKLAIEYANQAIKDKFKDMDPEGLDSNRVGSYWRGSFAKAFQEYTK